MNEKSDDYKALQMQTCGEEAKKDLLEIVGKSELANLCYAYKSRVKSEDKLIEKVARKTKVKDNYKLNTVTDVVGLRLITIFRSDMVDIVEIILKLIKHQEEITPNCFIKDSIEEIKFYSPHQHDHMVNDIRNVVEPLCGNLMDEEISPEGYSSIHILARLNTEVKCLSMDETFYVPVEIQIRTVFEDACGEIDHKYGYVIRQGKEIGAQVNNLEYVKLHLKALKKFTDACAEYANTIHAEAQGIVKASVVSGKVISVDADDEIIDRFNELLVSKEYINSYLEYRDMKIKAQEISSANPERLLVAAEGFKELSKAIYIEDMGNQGIRLIYLYTKLNEAVCLFSTNIRDEIIIASEIYEKIEGDFLEFPLVKMRLGQVYGKLGYVDKSIEKLEQAKGMIEAFDLSSNTMSDTLPKVDYEHMVKFLPRLLGYQYWIKAVNIWDADQQLGMELLEKAYSETKKALGHDRTDKISELRTYNNLVYYAVFYLSHVSSSPKGNFSVNLNKEMQGYLSVLERESPLTNCEDLETIDTFVDAYTFLNDANNQVKAAKRMLDIALEGEGANLRMTKVERSDLAEKAYKLLKENNGV